MSRRLAPALAAAFLAPFALGALLAAPATAHAKDLRGRIGAGFNTSFGQVNALSMRWGVPTPDPAINVQTELDLGFATYQDTDSALFAGGRVLYGVVAEDNMNLYVGAGAGYIGYAGEGLVRIQPAASVDFFLFGLENLAFNANWGLNLDAGQATGLSTTASLGAGMHYFF
jgi:hypothetical protein